MIWTEYTTIMLVLGLLSIVLTAYAAPKALLIWRKLGKAGLEEKYTLQKEFYLLSSVVWIVLLTRIISMPLYWVTNESLIPLIPGAMCQWGVHQAGHPYSWIDSNLKVVVILVYGVWLSLDWINRQCKKAPLMVSLSKVFIFLTPILIIDSALDLAFYYTVEPITVPCCRVVFTAENPLPCPFCFVFHDAPMMLGVISGYGLAIAFVVWGVLVRRYIQEPGELSEVSIKVLKTLVNLSLIFAVIGTIALIPAILQVLGPL